MDDKMGPPPGYPNAPQGYPQQPPPPAGYAQQPPPAGYAQPPMGYAQPAGYPQGQPGQITIVNQPGNRSFGTDPVTMNCPYCSVNITTSTNRTCGGLVWIVFGVICLIGLFLFPFILLGCCLIPFCIPSLYNVSHTCPNCQRSLGSHKAGGI